MSRLPAAITGPEEVVDRHVNGLTTIGKRQLGRTERVTIYDTLDDTARQQIRAAGLELEPVPLQDLFVHLTAPKKEPS